MFEAFVRLLVGPIPDSGTLDRMARARPREEPLKCLSERLSRG
jgi:hypothetical protein